LIVLINAFANASKEHPDWRLWIIGPRNRQESQNIDEEEVEEIIKPYKDLESKIHYWGRIDDRQTLATIIGASDVFVFPSRKEGMGIAPMEAMSAGVPVIISRIPGITDQASIDGVSGRYIQVNDADGLRNAMIELGSDPELRERMGQAARQRIEQEFGWEKHIDEWEALYTSLYNHRV